MHKKWLFILLIIMLCGCGLDTTRSYSTEDPEGRTVITIDTYGKDSFLEMDISAFNESNSRYFVKTLTYNVEYSEYLNLRAEKIFSGQGADIYDLIGDYRINKYVENGLLERLDPYIESGLRKKDYIDNVFDTCRYNNVTYGIPAYLWVTMIAGNKNMFPSDLYVSFRELCSILNKTNPYEFILAWSDMQAMWELYNKFGMDIENPEQLREGIALIDKYYHDPKEERDSLLQLGKNIALLSVGIDNLNMWNSQRGFLGEYGEDFFPVNGAYISGNIYGINHASENKDGAWEFLKFILSEERQRKGNPQYLKVFKPLLLEKVDGEAEMLAKIKNLPKEELKDYYLDAISGCLKSGKNMYFITGDYDKWLIVEEEVQAYFDGKQGIDETLELIQFKINQYEKNKQF